MFPPSPNEKKDDQSIFARICYFIGGLGIGLVAILSRPGRGLLYDQPVIVPGLVVLLFGIACMLAGKAFFRGSWWH